MSVTDELIDAHCPQCADDQIHIERLVDLPTCESSAYLCRCGACGWRFRVYTPDPVAPPLAAA